MNLHSEKIGYNHYCKAVTESSTKQPTQQTQFAKIRKAGNEP